MANPTPELGQYYATLLNEMWASKVINEEDYHNLVELLVVIAQPVGDVQKELRNGGRYAAKAGHYYRYFRRLREVAEEELDGIFFNFYNSVRSEKYGEEAKAESELPMPVLKNLQKAKKQDAPKGHFSKDLVKCHAMKDAAYQQQMAQVIRLNYFEGELEEIKGAFAQRQADIAQWSNNNRQLNRSTGE